MAASPRLQIGPGLPPNTLIKGRWKVLRKIGQGAFGEIYSGRNVVTSELVAIKVERADSKKQVLKLEVAVLKKLQSCPLVVCFITCGRHADYNYMVMELLGDSVSELRRRQPSGRFSMLTSLKLGMQMLKAIEAVHELGYLHRDIKPSNFAMGLTPQKRNTCYLIDFGLSRRYLLPSGEVRPSREQSGFRGTARYASIFSHESKDLGRRDDLWSLFYLLVEFASGTLPWRKLKEKEQVGEMKAKIPTAELVKELPPEFFLFAQHLEALDYADRPNYGYLQGLLQAIFTRLGGDDNTPFDWDRQPVRVAQRVRPLVPLADLAFLVFANHFERLAEPARPLPVIVKSRLLAHFIRVKQGRVPLSHLVRLLDPAMGDLDLAMCELTDADYTPVAQACVKLRSLTLGAVSDPVLKILLTHTAPRLEQLALHCSKGFTSKGAKSIAECEQLTCLRLRNSDRLSDSNLESIFEHCGRLAELSLFGCKKIKGEALKTLAKNKKRPLALRSLNLSGCELSKKGWKYLQRVAPELQTLVLAPLSAGFKLMTTDLVELVQAGTGLTALDLANHHCEMDLILGEVAKHCTRLQRLVVEGLGMSDNGVLAVLTIPYGDGVTDASLTQLAITCSALCSLSLDFLATNTSRRLSVSDHAVRAVLCGCTLLRELNLPACYMLTAQSFPENAVLPALSSLNLRECYQLNDAAVRRIVESCPFLRRLDLGDLNSLTEATLLALPLFCPSLDELSLVNSACFTDDQLRQLLRALPRLFVRVTRFIDPDLRGVEREVSLARLDKLFQFYPNTHREKALERARKRSTL